MCFKRRIRSQDFESVRSLKGPTEVTKILCNDTIKSTKAAKYIYKTYHDTKR